MEMIERLTITYLANSAWMTCVIAAAAMLLAKLVRRGPSAYRHGLWVMAIAFASLSPLASLRNAFRVERDVLTASMDSTNTKTIRPADGTSSTRSFAFQRRLHHRTISFAPLLTDLLTALYLVFVLYRGLSLAWAWHRTQLVLRDAEYRALSPHQAETLARCCAALPLDQVSITSSQNLVSPVIAGVWRPRLILPEWFFSKASDEEFVSAISHELAHVRRHDFVLNLVHEVLFLPISFHPAAKFIKSRVERSRELACDEIAAANLPTPTVYARSLVNIAQTIAAMASSGRPGYALRLLSPDTLEERVVNLFGRRNHSDKTWGRAQTAVASGLLAAASLIASSFSIQVARAGNTPADLQRFVGTWEGKFKDKTFVSLKLLAKDGKLYGTVSRVNIQMTPSGILTDASALAGEDAISEAAPDGTVLHLNTKAKGHVVTTAGDFEESIQFDLRLTGRDQAELQIAGAPAGMVPAPWKLERKRAAP